MESLFSRVEPGPSDPVFGLFAEFQADPRKDKINLILGVYKNDALETPIFACVKEAEAFLLLQERNKDYFPIEGDKNYLDQVRKLVFGEKEVPMAAIQSIGGTGALWLGGKLLKDQEISSRLYYSDPTWVNHMQIMSKVGFAIESYPYYNITEHRFEFEKMIAFLSQVPDHSTVLLHASCHNPTGVDPTREEWVMLSELFLKKRLIPFFDMAYQGFARGIDEDASAIRLFVQRGHELLVASSFSKNFGLYGERLGALFVVTHSEKEAGTLTSHLKILARTCYSNPPIHGAKIVTHVLSDSHRKKQWEDELSYMRERIREKKTLLAKALMEGMQRKELGELGERRGLFSYCGLQPHQVERLKTEYGIYTARDGRMNVAGLNDQNWERVVTSIIEVSRE